jgi:hypothetical protein
MNHPPTALVGFSFSQSLAVGEFSKGRANLSNGDSMRSAPSRFSGISLTHTDRLASEEEQSILALRLNRSILSKLPVLAP